MEEFHPELCRYGPRCRNAKQVSSNMWVGMSNRYCYYIHPNESKESFTKRNRINIPATSVTDEMKDSLKKESTLKEQKELAREIEKKTIPAVRLRLPRVSANMSWISVVQKSIDTHPKGDRAVAKCSQDVPRVSPKGKILRKYVKIERKNVSGSEPILAKCLGKKRVLTNDAGQKNPKKIRDDTMVFIIPRENAMDALRSIIRSGVRNFTLRYLF